MQIVANLLQSVLPDEAAVLEDSLKFIVLLSLSPSQTILIGIAVTILDNPAASTLLLLKVAGVGLWVLENHNRITVGILGIGCLDCDAKDIAGIGGIVLSDLRSTKCI